MKVSSACCVAQQIICQLAVNVWVVCEDSVRRSWLYVGSHEALWWWREAWCCSLWMTRQLNLVLYIVLSYFIRVSYTYLMSLRHSTVLKHTNEFPFALLMTYLVYLSSNTKAVPKILLCLSWTVEYTAEQGCGNMYEMKLGFSVKCDMVIPNIQNC
jgi:hypothetical protein